MSEFVFLVLGVLLGISMSVVDVLPETWDKAESLCQANSGVKEYYANVLGTSQVVCVNDARFNIRED